jgi:DNA transformation protein and related proteins
MASPLPEFVQHAIDLLAPTVRCQARRMFGGWGLSSEGLTLAIIADLGEGETLWLKTEPNTVAAFEAAGCRPFVYWAKGKPVTLGYRSAPEEAMESPALMATWARLAWGAALSAQAVKARQSPKTPRKTAL